MDDLIIRVSRESKVGVLYDKRNRLLTYALQTICSYLPIEI